MDCKSNLLHWLLAIASVSVVMALGVLTWLLWNMLRGVGRWK